jgi:hypothetical protein
MSTRTNITPSDYVSDTARAQLTVKTALANLRTSIPVEVVAVTNSGGVSPIGHVNVKPLVNLVDSNGVAWENPIIYNVPYMRIQGGSNAIIIDPQVGDIGIATVCDRDISTVKNTEKVSSPGSNRKFNMSDMVYLMTIIGRAPTQYIQFNASGITILSPTKVTINAPNIEIDASTACTINSPNIVLNGAISQGAGSYGGNATMAGSLTVTGDVTAEGTSVHTHKHGGVQTGGGQTGVPV